MKPIKLQMTGFLSYRDTAELDFEQFDLACISGNNGAGKSSILDAMTFALFGKARKNDASLINTASDKGEVIFTFEYEDIKYRIIRRLYKNKPFELDFQVYDQKAQLFQPISETNRRKTEDAIVQTLGLDYDTFTNASFFLQGEADSFTQKKPTERKEILGKILGLEKWEVYKSRASNQRKDKENEHKQNEFHLREVEKYLAGESEMISSFNSIQDELTRIASQKKTYQVLIEKLSQENDRRKLFEKDLAEQKTIVDQFETDKNTIIAEIEKLDAEKALLLELVAQKGEIEEKYLTWNRDQHQFDALRPVQQQYQKWTVEKTAAQAQINQDEAILKQEINSLEQQKIDLNHNQAELPTKEKELDRLKKELSKLNTANEEKNRLQNKKDLVNSLNTPILNIQQLHSDISQAKSKLEWSRDELQNRKVKLDQDLTKVSGLQKDLEQHQLEKKTFEKQIEDLKMREEAVADLKRQIDLHELGISQINQGLPELIGRRKHLTNTHSPNCSLCEQPLSETDRVILLNKLMAEESQLIQKHIELTDAITHCETEMGLLQKNTNSIAELENQKDTHTTLIAKLEADIIALKQRRLEWENVEALHLTEITANLEKDTYSLLFREDISKIKQSMLPILAELGISQSHTSLNDLKTGLNLFLEKNDQQLSQLERGLQSLPSITAQVATLKAEIDASKKEVADWQKKGAVLLEQKIQKLNQALFSLENRETLKKIDQQLATLGFDPSAYSNLETLVFEGRSINEKWQNLGKAESNLEQIERRLTDKKEIFGKLNAQITQNKSKLSEISTRLSSYSDDSTSLEEANHQKLITEVRESELNQELGQKQLQLKQIEEQKKLKQTIEKEQVGLASDIKHISTLESAFGKNGIPALLIEQAIPNIEDKANELLGRLTNDTMSIRIGTQKAYADKNRPDLKETLEIRISDGSEYKDYEMYSGGEAFRVNFAIRLALSEVLTSRKNAKLQTLVIDEGFGSQDTEGREKLKQCINVIKDDFAKILIITHLDDLKEAFPNRIEIEKSHGTSLISLN